MASLPQEGGRGPTELAGWQVRSLGGKQQVSASNRTDTLAQNLHIWRPSEYNHREFPGWQGIAVSLVS